MLKKFRIRNSYTSCIIKCNGSVGNKSSYSSHHADTVITIGLQRRPVQLRWPINNHSIIRRLDVRSKFFQLCHKTAEAVIFFAIGFE